MQSKSNYILLNLTASSESTGNLTFSGLNGEKFNFTFSISPGTYNYLIRSSIDSYWGTTDFNLELESDAHFELNDIKLLKGD